MLGAGLFAIVFGLIEAQEWGWTSANTLGFLIGLEPDSGYGSLWPPLVMVGFGLGFVITASAEAIVGNAPVDDAGVASGLQSTAIQVGGMMGTAILGSILAGQVGAVLFEKLTEAGVPAAVARQLEGAKELVGQGQAPVQSIPANLRSAVVTGSHEAFMAGLHTSMLVGGILALAAAAAALFVQRTENPGAAGAAAV